MCKTSNRYLLNLLELHHLVIITCIDQAGEQLATRYTPGNSFIGFHKLNYIVLCTRLFGTGRVWGWKGMVRW